MVLLVGAGVHRELLGGRYGVDSDTRTDLECVLCNTLEIHYFHFLDPRKSRSDQNVEVGFYGSKSI